MYGLVAPVTLLKGPEIEVDDCRLPVKVTVIASPERLSESTGAGAVTFTAVLGTSLPGTPASRR